MKSEVNSTDASEKMQNLAEISRRSTVKKALIPLVICVLAFAYASSLKAQEYTGDGEKRSSAPTYSENFQYLCREVAPFSQKIVSQPLHSNPAVISEAFLKSKTVRELKLIRSNPPAKLWIGAKEVDAGNPISWTQLETRDQRTRVDVLKYSSSVLAAKVMEQRDQPHSGTMGYRNSCFITIVAPRKKNAVNAVFRRGPLLFNIRRGLPFCVRISSKWDGISPEQFGGMEDLNHAGAAHKPARY